MAAQFFVAIAPPFTSDLNDAEGFFKAYLALPVVLFFWVVGYVWKRKGWVTAAGENVKNQDIIRAVLDKMSERVKAGGQTKFQWVKGHATDKGNIAADRLAVNGAKGML